MNSIMFIYLFIINAVLEQQQKQQQQNLEFYAN